MTDDTSGFSPMKLGYRNTRCHWGTHIACFYQTEDERDNLISGFLNRGLQDGDFLAYCPAEQGEKSFKQNLLENCPDFRLHIDDPDRISIISPEEAYYPNGQFSREGMDKTLLTLYERQFLGYHRNIRFATEMIWAIDGLNGSKDLTAYETEMNLLVPNRNIVAICLYNLNIFSKELILRVLKTHPYTMSRGIMTRSTYYEPPTHYMKINESHGSHNFQHVSGI